MVIEKCKGLVLIDHKLSAARFRHLKLIFIQKGTTNQGDEDGCGRRRALRHPRILQITETVSLVWKHKARGGTNVIVGEKGNICSWYYEVDYHRGAGGYRIRIGRRNGGE